MQKCYSKKNKNPNKLKAWNTNLETNQTSSMSSPKYSWGNPSEAAPEAVFVCMYVSHPGGGHLGERSSWHIDVVIEATGVEFGRKCIEWKIGLGQSPKGPSTFQWETEKEQLETKKIK